jgi:hypothetical protein
MHLYEITDRAVVGPLKLGVEKTCRQLAVLAVIVQALAAFMLPLTRLIRAIAHLLIIFDNTIHGLPPGWNILYFNRKGKESASEFFILTSSLW